MKEIVDLLLMLLAGGCLGFFACFVWMDDILKKASEKLALSRAILKDANAKLSAAIETYDSVSEKLDRIREAAE